MRNDNNATIVITHYQRLLDYIKPDVIHILYKGRIVYTGGPSSPSRLRRKATTGSRPRSTARKN